METQIIYYCKNPSKHVIYPFLKNPSVGADIIRPFFYFSGFSLILTLCLGYLAGVADFFSMKTTDLPPAGIS